MLTPEDTFLFLGGFNLAMGCFHLVLFFFNRHKKANLYYGIGLVMVFLNFTMVDLATDPEFNSSTYKANVLISSATNGILLYFVSYYVFASLVPLLQRVLKFFAGFYIIALFVLASLSPETAYLDYVAQTLRGIVYLSTLAICILGLLERLPYFHLIVVTTLLLLVTEAFAGVDVFGIWHPSNPYPPLRTTLILIGYSVPFLTYSAYLSKDLAVVAKKLTRELIMNERLTREKYEQEIATRKILEAQNLELERNVQRRTLEISNQKEELRAQAEKIIELDKLKTNFFANISHEFRTPLTLILGPLEKRISEARAGENTDDFFVMKRNALRLLNLVNQLLDLARLDAGSIKIKPTAIDLGQVLTTVSGHFQSLAESKRVHFSTHFTDIIHLHADREMLTKVFNNLLSNAFKFTPDGGTITMLIRKGEANSTFANGYAEIQVADTGIGIPKEQLPMVFDRFYQVDHATARQMEGSGIGLALSKELVELHGGRIMVSSSVDQGSCFTIQLPLQREMEVPATDPAIVEEDFMFDQHAVNEPVLSQPPPNEAMAKVLLVDDNADMRLYLRECLAGKYAIVEAADGDEGIALAISEVPDLIVTDVMMPGTDGMQLCHAVKTDEKTSHIPIILLTARVGVDFRIEGYAVGADAYIPKPFSAQELHARVENLIENRIRLQRKLVKNFSLQPAAIQVSSLEERFIQKVVQCVESHLSNSGFSVETLASEMAMSSVQVYRKLKALTNQTPNDLIRNMRLDRAESLLKQRGGNVAEIAFQVGFVNLSYFSKCFREKFNATPSEVLKNGEVSKSATSIE